jgi:hypothetical protein
MSICYVHGCRRQRQDRLVICDSHYKKWVERDHVTTSWADFIQDVVVQKVIWGEWRERIDTWA